MKLVILHHHLHPGGVTRIIESQVKALGMLHRNIEIKILAGDAPQNLQGLDKCTVRNFACLNYMPPESSPSDVFKSVNEVLRLEISKDDIVHAHNMNLGKNPALTAAVSGLALDGYRVFLHCHDFAEDRPANLNFMKQVFHKLGISYERAVYPESDRSFYGVLSSHDAKRLESCGVMKDRVSLLPNPVDLGIIGEIPDHAESRKRIRSALGLHGDGKIFLYPVRAIKRKNIGELILLAAVFGEKADWIITQPPKNPSEIPLFRKWTEFSKARKLPVAFNAGLSCGFAELLSGCDACVTTSVMEGFGMAYLEPWCFGKAVYGRKIDTITEDLKNAGLVFPLLYDSIEVERDACITDFAGLPSEIQMDIVDGVAGDRKAATEILERNPFLWNFFNEADAQIVSGNRKVIEEKFSLSGYGRKLYEIYEKMV